MKNSNKMSVCGSEPFVFHLENNAITVPTVIFSSRWFHVFQQ